MMMDISCEDYVTVDDIHFTGFSAMAAANYHNCAIIKASNGGRSLDDNLVLNRLLVDKMAIGVWANGHAGNSSRCIMVDFYTGVPPGSGVSILENSTFLGDGNTYGRATENIPNYMNDTMSGIPEGEIYPAGTGVVAGNNLSYCAVNPTTGLMQDPSDGGAPQGGIHADAIQVQGVAGASTFYIYDNVIHDTGASNHTECESIITYGSRGETDYVWDNVLYNLGGNPIDIDARAQNGSPPTAFYAWNNSMTGGFNGPGGNGSGDPPYPLNSNQPCFGSAGSPASEAIVVIQNNLCITNSTLMSANIAGTQTQTVDHNLVYTPAKVRPGGPYAGDFAMPGGSNLFVWLPMNGSTPVAGAGSNLTSDCTGRMAPLCSDATLGGMRTP